MRIFLLVFRSSLFMPALVEHVVVAGQFDVVGVGEAEATQRRSRSKWLARQTGYWGAWGTVWIAAATILRKLPALLRFPRPFRRLSSVAECCQALEIPYERVADVNDAAFIAKTGELDVDIIVSFQQQIFRKELLNTPNIGCLNVHTGILPAYRGLKPIFWMQSRGEPELGVTVHTMTERVDEGRIVVQRRWKRRGNSSVLENQLWSYRCAAHCIVEAVEKVAGCALVATEDSRAAAEYFKAPTKSQRDLALARGTRLI
jgi:methionyl-tRNA formyltransferase